MMCWTSLRRVVITACTALIVCGAPTASRAACALTDWLFGNGKTSYAPAYAPPCGCAPVQPACQPCCTPTSYRISYRPVSTVAYMPVLGVDPCSGCAVTTYQPRQTWTYQASLDPYTPYRAAYAPAAVVGPCSSCGCAPCSGYAPSSNCSSCVASYSGCSSCGSSYGGCSSCSSDISGSSGISGDYTASGGCSSCGAISAPVTSAPLSAPSDLGRPVTTSPTPASSGPVLGSPAAAPNSPGTLEPRTYEPGAKGAPISPTAPGTSSSSSFYQIPAKSEGSRTVEPPRIQGVDPLPNSGPQLSPAPAPRPVNQNLTTSRPIQQATYFQLLPSSPPKAPVQTISAHSAPTPTPVAPFPVDDGGWHAGN
jgi:hypothetical protein